MLAFLMPGFLHEFGNAVFAVQGQAQQLTGDGDATRPKAAILAACSRAGAELDVIRWIVEPHVLYEPLPAGPVIARVLQHLRIALRGREVAVRIDESVRNLATRLPPGTVSRAVAEVGLLVADALPTGYQGELTGSLDPGGNLRLELAEQRLQLPFAVDLAPAVVAATRTLAAIGGGAAPAAHGVQGLVLHLPVAYEAGRGS